MNIIMKILQASLVIVFIRYIEAYRSVTSKHSKKLDNQCSKETLNKEIYNSLFQPMFNDDPVIIRIIPENPCQVALYNYERYQVAGMGCKGPIPSPPLEGIRRYQVDFLYMALDDTAIKELGPGDLDSWSTVDRLQISSNFALTTLHPGVFDKMEYVWNLTIRDNALLSVLHKDTFRGLVRMGELSFLRNGLKKIINITPALSPGAIPNLTVIDLSGNEISSIERDEFLPMIGSRIHLLSLTMCGLKYIAPTALNILKHLRKLELGRNLINNYVSAALLKNLAASVSRLKEVSLENNLVLNGPKHLFRIIANTTIINLDVSDNQFGEIHSGFFPVMANLQTLDLSLLNIRYMPEGIINATIMPRLYNLTIRKNSLLGIPTTIALPSLTMLDMSNNGDINWQARFNVTFNFLNLFPKLEHLYLTGNRIIRVRPQMFTNCTNLKTLWLNEAGIIRLDNYIFKSCSNLSYLDLSKNLFNEGDFEVLTSEVFMGLKNLIGLNLAECDLTRFKDKHLFKNLRSLKYLSLRKNSLLQLDGLFNNVKCLQHFDARYNILQEWYTQQFEHTRLNSILLDGNQIVTITKTMYAEFFQTDMVSLYLNRINCDCNLLDSTRAFLDGNTTINFCYLSRPTNRCYYPQELKNQTLFKWLVNHVPTSDCRQMSSGLKTLIITSVTVLSTMALYFIWYHFKYHIKYWYYATKEKIGLLILPSKKRQRLNREDGYDYDAFVSYSHEDYKFVHKMTTILENEFHFKLCLYDRDFDIGELISESVMDKLSRSRKAIMVVTEAFAKSQWCLWELSIAQQRATFFRTVAPDSLVIVMIGDIDESLMTATLRHLVQARIYLKWEKGIVQQRLFWQQLRDTINRR